MVQGGKDFGGDEVFGQCCVSRDGDVSLQYVDLSVGLSTTFVQT